ncbi:MAG: amino acid adenylation domain-containing protein [Lewinellaceae bacterium]|nr:amino acid adenylation domain-containing protein [Lewinellaceae bacterium]
MLTELEALQLQAWNNTQAEFPSHKTIIDLFEEQVEKTPHNIAVIFEGKELTYCSLNEKANQVGHFLRETYRIHSDDIIALQVERSEWMIIAILGVMKAGAAYLPIDPKLPMARVKFILHHSQAKGLITDVTTLKAARKLTDILPVLEIEKIKSPRIHNPPGINDSRDLAYVIYTSGSTGLPKGVMIEHRGVVNLVCFQIKFLDIKESDRVLQFASYTFDASVAETLTGILSGATLVVAGEESKSPDYFLKMVEDQKISVFSLPPAFLSQLDRKRMNNIRVLLTGGEKPVLEDVWYYSKKCRYFNGYGPTENSIGISMFEIPEGWDKHIVPVGKPISNVEVFILNNSNELQPIGAEGEICVSGVGLARGYLNDETLTREKFISHPFKKGERLYKTGDLGRWLPDGNIEFRGRIDHQLKIRGYRVEAGEVEQALLKHPAIQSCVVTAYDFKGRKELVAYLTPKKTDRIPTVSALYNFLGKTLPDYMIPAYFVELQTLPLSTSGKVDRKALPAPDQANLASGERYVAPRNDLEQKLVDLWQDVLRKKRIGIHDNFFHNGGDSIKAIQITSRIGMAGWKLSTKDIFTNPTIAKLAGRIRRKKQSYDQGLASGVVPLTPIQRWFFDQHNELHYFNQAMLLEWPQPIDIPVLENCLLTLAQHHDMLRTTFRRQSEDWIQYISEQATLDFKVEVLSDTADRAETIERLANQAQAGFDLAAGPLMKAIVFRQAQENDLLLLIIHHAIVDWVSWRILLEDLKIVYRQSLQGKQIELPEKTASFLLWIQTMEHYVAERLKLKECDYWASVVLESNESTDLLPVDNSHKHNLVKDTKIVTVGLSEAETNVLLYETHQAFNTEINEVLLCALSQALKHAFGGDTYSVVLEGHGREDILDLDVSRTVGWFTAIFPFVLKYEDASNIGWRLQLIKEQLRAIPNKGIGYGLQQYLNEDAILPDWQNPVIGFNYLGAFEGLGAEKNKDTALFYFSNHSVGRSYSPYKQRGQELEVSGSIVDHRLSLSIEYNEQRIDSEVITDLLANFKKALIELIQYCAAVEEPKLTPADFTACPMNLEKYSAFLTSHALAAPAIADVYPLTPVQEGMLFHKLLTPDSIAYFVQLEIGLSGALNAKRLRAAAQQLIDRHSVFRTAFFTEFTDRPVQVVFKEQAVAFEVIDLTDLPEKIQGQRIQIYLFANKTKGFDLSKPPLLRFALFKIAERRHRLVISTHHILIDGWSVPIFLKQLLDLYEGEKRIDFEGLPVYAEYISRLENQERENPVIFWRDYLAGYEAQPLIPNLKIFDKQDTIIPREHVFSLSGGQTGALSRLAARYQVSLNTLIQAIWAILLGSYNQKEDVVFGVTTSGRSIDMEGIEQMLGLFINTIPLRVTWEPGQSFVTLLQRLQEQSLAVQTYDYFGLTQIKASSNQQVDLFDHIMIFENYPVEETLNDGRDVKVVSSTTFDPTHYGLALLLAPGEQLGIKLVYQEQAWPAAWAKRLETHIRQAVSNILKQPDQPIGQIDILPAAERRQILEEFNDTRAGFPADKTIIDLFEEQVEKGPEHIAVIFGDTSLTYRQLNEKANQLARYLRTNYHIKADDIIALQLERSEWMLIAIFGILKSGAAYLPIAPDSPKARTVYMLEDSRAKALLADDATFPTAKELEGLLPVLALEKLVHNNVSPSAIPAFNPEEREQLSSPNDLAYIIYTSGSTGRPKGVMIEHQGVVNRLNWMRKAYPIGATDCILQKTPYTFDVSVWELLWWSLQGAKVAILEPGGEKEPAKIVAAIEKYRVTAMHFVPSMLNAFLAYIRQFPISGETLSLKQVFASGEALGAEQIRQFFHLIGNEQTALHNLYGPTEASIDVSYYDCRELGNQSIVPIGKPIDNIQLYIINKNEQLTPIGIAGELCISGAGLARGYLNNPELTAQKFIPHPFEAGKRFYKTGDLARWLPDGNIEFLGRIDHQLKIRGYRIEAGEIEQYLLQHPSIQSVVVIGKEMGQGKELAAYLVARKQMAPEAESLRSFLSEQLPAYMIPSYFVELKALPLTSSGKVDRKVLPDPESTGLAAGTAYVAPHSTTEAALTDIWQSVLQRTRIGIHDNFLDLGGHSLKAIRLAAFIQQRLSVKIDLSEIFDHPTIAKLAKVIDSKEKTVLMAIPSIE